MSADNDPYINAGVQENWPPVVATDFCRQRGNAMNDTYLAGFACALTRALRFCCRPE